MKFSALSHWGPMYWNAATYRSAMWLLRPSGERAQILDQIAREVGTDSVLDLCCGPGDLIRYLDSTAYAGIDWHAGFVQQLQQRGYAVQCGDVLRVDWPAAESLVIVDSLYFFMAAGDLFWERVRAHPARRIIISESVEHWQPKLPQGLRSLGLWLTRVNGRLVGERYSEEILKRLLTRVGFQRFDRTGHNVTAVWEKPLSAAPRSSRIPDTALLTSAH